MRLVYPFEFELNPKEIDTGIQWVRLRLKNIGDETVHGLDVKLHSLDSFGISIFGTGEYIFMLMPGEEKFRAFQVLADATTELYVSVAGLKDRERFLVESPWVTVKVGKEVAELESVFALTEPYTSMGKVVKIEAKVKGLKDSKGLDLEFRAQTPSGESKELAKIETKELSAGQEVRYTAEMTPKESGFFTIHAYLYHNWRRIGHKSETIWVEK
ncbi:MAG: hypothetical protein ABSF44_07890 [Candidatus Bathyarchaeia archaeon]